MILLKIWLIIVLIMIYSFFLSAENKTDDGQYKDFFKVMRTIFFITFILSFILGVASILYYIKK